MISRKKGEYEVKLICNVEPIELELDLVTVLGIVTTEITANSYLHAFPDRAGMISVTLVKDGNAGTLTISDNGAGFEQKNESKRHGVGLFIRLMEQIKGTAHVQSDNATAWTLTFPVA